jgi:hypothetical protein
MRAGKRIGGCVYVHRDYVEVDVARQAALLPVGFDYVLVKMNSVTGAVTFIQCADFGTAHEPTMGDAILVGSDNSVKMMKALPDPWVYHHKWMMVGSDYAGFDVAASKARSAAWTALPGVDKSRIGKKSYWTANVMAHLHE